MHDTVTALTAVVDEVVREIKRKGDYDRFGTVTYIDVDINTKNRCIVFRVRYNNPHAPLPQIFIPGR